MQDKTWSENTAFILLAILRNLTCSVCLLIQAALTEIQTPLELSAYFLLKKTRKKKTMCTSEGQL